MNRVYSSAANRFLFFQAMVIACCARVFKKTSGGHIFPVHVTFGGLMMRQFVADLILFGALGHFVIAVVGCGGGDPPPLPTVAQCSDGCQQGNPNITDTCRSQDDGRCQAFDNCVDKKVSAGCGCHTFRRPNPNGEEFPEQLSCSCSTQKEVEEWEKQYPPSA